MATKRICTVLAILMVTVFAGTTQAAGGETLVLNGGFKAFDAITMQPESWNKAILGEGGTVEVVADGGHDGAALRQTTAESDKYGVYVSQNVALSPGNYTISAWIKNPDATKGKAEITVTCNDAESSVITGTKKNFAWTDAYETWKNVTDTFTAPDGTASITLMVRNTATTVTTLFWDDIAVFATPVETHPELLEYGDMETEGKWGAKNATVTYVADAYDGSQCVQLVNKNTANGTFGVTSPALTNLVAGKAYRIQFWFKTNATYKVIPFIRATHTYALNTDTTQTKSLQVDFASNRVEYKIVSPSVTFPGDTLDMPLAETNTWKQYTFYYAVPLFDEAYTLSKVVMQIGQSGSYIGTSTADMQASTVWLDNVSVKEDYNEAVFCDAAGKSISALPESGGTVKTRVHVARAGKATDIKTPMLFSGLYEKKNSAKMLLSSLNVLAQPNGEAKTLEKTASSVDYTLDVMHTTCSEDDTVYSYSVPATGVHQIGVYYWDSFAGMKPLGEKDSISQ